MTRSHRHTAPHAVLWDMDGTLVDTEPAWITAEFALAERYDGSWSHEHALNLVGNDLLTSAAYIRVHMGIDLSPERIVDELLVEVVAAVRREVPWRPGARELLVGHVESGIPAALVTMSYRRFAQAVVDALPEDTFSAMVVGDEVDNGKPHPEPYLAAAALLGADPRHCLAIEDSATGATSAEAAGCAVLVVPNHVEVPPSARRVFRADLRAVAVGDLSGLCVAASG
ncbi:MAG TPA: HAD family phosphatase [Nocardioidaceae bacterium]|nr:HAD family phosphatase [Nocardioidaceae bacterium]